MIIKEIETQLTSGDIFALFKDRRHCFFLDSGMDHENLGRYSFIGFEPEITFKSKDGVVTVEGAGRDTTGPANPFDALKALLENYETLYTMDLPFIGGAVGYFGYDLCHHIEKLPTTAADDMGLPDCFFGIYDFVIAFDHLTGKVCVASPEIFGEAQERIANIEKIIKGEKPGRGSPHLTANGPKTKLKPNMSIEQYMRAIAKIKAYIEAGDIYQVNMTQRFECETGLSPADLYCRLRHINPAPFACYLDFGCGQLLSSSPERFLQLSAGKIYTRPIKGTRPRGKTPQEDEAYKKELPKSEKDKAELLMIVDLERNDLGKACKTGTVKVTELFKIEEYPTVFHLVATVEGEPDEGICAVDCVKALFPGGSITGAPKIRAMEIIDELEPTRRNIYTGTIGYIGFNGDADLNIAIRTIVQTGDKAVFQVGGGIVWDSDAKAEYRESIDKAKALINALNAEL